MTTLKQFLYQIRRQAGDPAGHKISEEMLLESLTEESRYIAAIMPSQVYITGTNTDGTFDAADIEVKQVYIDNVPARKVYASYMAQVVDSTASYYGEPIWSKISIGSVVTAFPTDKDIRVIGFWIPPQYSLKDLDSTVVSPTVEPATDEVPLLNGTRMNLLRYRMLQRATEDLGDIQKAQYYMQISFRKEQEALGTWEPDTTTSIGEVAGGDWL